MPSPGQLQNAIQDAFKVPKEPVQHCYRTLREAGLLTAGKQGKGSSVSVKDASRLLIAVAFGKNSYTESSLDAWKHYFDMPSSAPRNANKAVGRLGGAPLFSKSKDHKFEDAIADLIERSSTQEFMTWCHKIKPYLQGENEEFFYLGHLKIDLDYPSKCAYIRFHNGVDDYQTVFYSSGPDIFSTPNPWEDCDGFSAAVEAHQRHASKMRHYGDLRRTVSFGIETLKHVSAIFTDAGGASP